MELYSAGELADHEFEERPFLVDPLIPQGGIVLLHGKRGLGKSQFAMTLAHAVVNGFDLFGLLPTMKGTVVFLQTDMTPEIQQLRLLKVWDSVTLEGLHFAFPVPCNVVEFNKHHPIVTSLMELEPSLIIWDTLRKIHRMREGSSDTVQVVYENLKQYFPGVTHLMIHHDKKTVIDQGNLDQEELFRGSGAWIDDADTSLQLTETGSRRKRIKLWIHKCRTMAEDLRPNIILEMDPETMLLQPHSPNQGQKVYDVLREEMPDASNAQMIDALLARGACTRRQAGMIVSSPLIR